jgi:hypothetical protein
MLGRELTGRQVGPVGLLEPGEKDPQILPVVPLRIAGEAFFDLAIIQKGNQVAAQRLPHMASVYLIRTMFVKRTKYTKKEPTLDLNVLCVVIYFTIWHVLSSIDSIIQLKLYK